MSMHKSANLTCAGHNARVFICKENHMKQNQEQINQFSSSFNALVEEKGVRLIDISRETGIPRATLTRYKKRQRFPVYEKSFGIGIVFQGVN